MDWRAAEESFTSPVIDRTTLPRMLEDSAARNTDRPAQAYKGGVYDRSLVPDILEPAPDGDFHRITYGQVRDIVRRLTAGFRELGVDAGERVGIFAHTRMEWAQVDFAILAAGGVVTTVYPSSSERQVEYLLDDSGASAVVVEGQDELDRLLAVEDTLDLEFIVAIDEVDDRGRSDIHSLRDVYDLGADDFDRSDYESWLDERDPGDLASLIYTSGTTGQPKGVQLTHWNFRSNVNQTYRRFGPRPNRDYPAIDNTSRAVSFLPLAHVFERLSGHFLMFAAGAMVAYAESPNTLQEDFQLIEPTSGSSVPRVYEKIYDAIRDEASSSPIRERIFHWATGVGRDYHDAADPGPWLAAKYAIADRLVFSQVREALGGEIEFLISGGGSLSPELCRLYHGMGLPVLEGYGLTETSPVLTVNPPGAPRVGTIGPPVEDTETYLDESVATPEMIEEADGDVGELLVRGPQVSGGYWNLPDKTDAAFVDDVPGREAGDPWFRTGDIVEQYEDDYIRFIERSKEILTLSTGKNVAPGPIEDAFASNDLVEQVMVIGNDRKFVSALMVPNMEAVRTWADRNDVDLPEDPNEIVEDDRVHECIESVVDDVNEQFEDYETIKRFRLVPQEFTEDNGLLTPTMKKRRRDISDRYQARIEDMYPD
ncbi:MAG: long-chain fatty acid--CoA ligase [Halobacteriaceae archaeon]